jgi:hypothetical protein
MWLFSTDKFVVYVTPTFGFTDGTAGCDELLEFCGRSSSPSLAELMEAFLFFGGEVEEFRSGTSPTLFDFVHMVVVTEYLGNSEGAVALHFINQPMEGVTDRTIALLAVGHTTHTFFGLIVVSHVSQVKKE